MVGEVVQIIFIPPIKWTDLYQRPQQIASQLSRRFIVIWIDKPSFCLSAMFKAFCKKTSLFKH
ncbi:MAG: hypothetical protein QW670_04490, partial [Candidatus Bathyarchaeia archaeon]